MNKINEDKHTKITLRDMLVEAFQKSYGGRTLWKNKTERDTIRDSLIGWYEDYYGEKADNKSDADKIKKPIYILNLEKEMLINNIDTFVENTIAGMRSYPHDKYLLAQKIAHFFSYLNSECGLHIDLDVLSCFQNMNKCERQIRLLRHLHSGIKSRVDIAEAFGISTKLLNKDLKELENGFEFLGSTMKLENLVRGSNTYKSTIHPLFLAMNMSEIYSLTVGMKLLSQGTLFEETLSGVADKIYMQLSDYAKEIVDKHSEPNHLLFEGQSMYFQGTQRLMEKSKKPFIYYIKEPIQCKVTYRSGKKEDSLIGTLHLEKSGLDKFSKVVVKTDDKDVELDIYDVVKIEKV